MRGNTDSLLNRAATTSTTGTLNNLTTNLAWQTTTTGGNHSIRSQCANVLVDKGKYNEFRIAHNKLIYVIYFFLKACPYESKVPTTIVQNVLLKYS